MAERRRSTLPPVSFLGALAGALTALAAGPLLGCASGGAADDADGVDSSFPPPADGSLEAVPPSRFCVTDGHVDDRGGSTLVTGSGGMRGVVDGDDGQKAELAIAYEGPSPVTSPLGNGEVRRQIGLKLRALDTCNVVYVMWHVEPTPGVHVSVKRNRGMSTHAECRDGGYLNVRPETSAPAPVLRPGEPHFLRAELEGDRLEVRADGVRVWSGRLPDEAAELAGPSGVRSDNGEFRFELRVPRTLRAHPLPTCDAVAR